MAKRPVAPSPASPATRVATLQMVAQDAGVSPSTVSRFLNGTAAISDDKRAAIDAAIRKLKFVPNPVASGLAGGRSRCIGVVTQALGSPFYGQGLMGIEDVLNDAGYAPLCVSGHWREADEQRCIASLLARRVDGIIILTACLSDEALLEHARKLPIVVTGRDLHGARLRSLTFDNHEGTRLATEHLLALGHRNIAFIKGTSSHPDAVERLRGYRSALKAHGIAYNAALTAQGHFIEEGGERAVEHWLDNGQTFSAILAANDQMACGAALALHRRGIRVPEDVSLIGFDDLPGSRYMLPPLTSVRHSIFEIGAIAARAIIAMLENGAPQLQAPAPLLVIRDSTGAPPS